jgi:hypothetical protein
MGCVLESQEFRVNIINRHAIPGKAQARVTFHASTPIQICPLALSDHSPRLIYPNLHPILCWSAFSVVINLRI